MRYDRSRLTLVEAPGGLPLTLEEVYLHLRVDTSGSPPTHPDETLIQGLMRAANNHVDGADGWLGRALVEQVWELRLDSFPERFKLPLPPLLEVVSIKYLDGDGAEQTVSSADYRVLTGDMALVTPAPEASWPSDVLDDVGSVVVRFRCGYEPDGSPPDEEGYGANVPQAIKQAMLLAIGWWYQHREDGDILPQASMNLLAPHRIYA